MTKLRKGSKRSTALLGGLLTLALWSFSLSQASAASWFPAPVLESARLENGNYVLSWSQPSSPFGTPDGGYDIFIDGRDTNSTWRTTGTSRTITGLNTKVDHTFQVEARWTQSFFSRSARSNSLTVAAAAGDTTAPTVTITSPSANTTITSAQTLSLAASASDDTGVEKVDFFVDGNLIGSDSTSPYSSSLSLSKADNGTLSLTAIAYDSAGNIGKSATVTVTVDIKEVYPAAILNSAKLENGNYVLNWSLPSGSTETPAGGYDILIDGVDTNTTWRTTGTSRIITGLDTSKAHTFLIEAQWTQADPDQFPRSNSLTVQAVAVDTTVPKVAITSPLANTTITSAQLLSFVVEASDDTGVKKVDFYVNDNLIGSDSASPYSVSLSLSAADNGTLNLSAIAHDSAGNTAKSASVAVTVNIKDYPAPVLNSAKLENGSYVLSWSLPSGTTETPAGGYDIFIDGVDTGTTWRTTGTSRTITGLDTKVAHTFLVEARWTQADPDQFPRSNQLSVAATDPVLPSEITLAWDPSSDSRVIGYRLYYKESADGDQSIPFDSTGLSAGDSPIDVGLNTSTTLNLPYKTTVFCFAVTAYSSDGLESDYSNIVCTGN